MNNRGKFFRSGSVFSAKKFLAMCLTSVALFAMVTQMLSVFASATVSARPQGTVGSDARTLQIVTIQYHANGGSGAPLTKTVYKDSHGAAWFTIAHRTPEKDGYDFIGWRLQGSTTTEVNTPGERIGLYTGRDGDETFTYLAAWKCKATNREAKGFDAADLVRAGNSYRQIQNTLEAEVVRIVNELRADYGLPALAISRPLADVARHRAQESTNYGYLTGHISHATGLAHTCHARAKGLDVEFAGENWGGSQRTPEDIVHAWMQSPGHRDFLLSGHETSRFSNNVYIGVGVAFDMSGEFVSNKNWILWQSR